MSLIHERYHVMQCLGSGSFTQTQLGLDLQSDQQPLVILKSLQPRHTEQGFLALARRLFQQEAQVLREMERYAAIPSLLDKFDADNVSYLVQEFISGVSLQEQFDQGQVWAEGELITFLKDALEILLQVHGIGIIHRDLKPAHWIRRPDCHSHAWEGPLTLIDFGVAQRSVTQGANGSCSKMPSVSIGTSGYMAPEQRQGYATFSSDLYALGLMAIQGVTGTRPTQLKHNAQGELYWQPLMPLSATMTDILARMVRYRAQDRYGSALEVLSDLQRYTHSLSWSRRLSQWLTSGRSHSVTRALTLPTPATSPKPLPPTASKLRPQVLLNVLGEVPGAFLYALEEAVCTQVWISDGLLQNWGRDTAQQASLEAALQATDVYVVGLTPESIVNPALVQHLQLFERLQQERPGFAPRLIPVRINLSGEAMLPNGVRQALLQVRQYVWRSPADTPRILEAIHRSVPALTQAHPLTSVA